MSNTLTTRQIAEYCRVAHNTVIRWVKSGKLKSSKDEDENSLINKKDFMEFLHSHNLPVSHELFENGSKRLLIVDDDVSVVDFLKEILSDIEDLEIETAYQGYEAGQKITEFKPHIVILDLWMPGINGFEICRHLKYNPQTSAIKILAITGYPCPNARQKIVGIGADYLLEKPLDTDLLRKVVLDLLNNGRTQVAERKNH